MDLLPNLDFYSLFYDVTVFITIYFVAICMGYTFILLLSIPDIYTSYKQDEIGNILSLTASYTLPPVTAIVPSYNEAAIIKDAVTNLLNSSYPNLHIIVVNADSTDNTFNIITHEFNMKPLTMAVQTKIKTSGELKGLYQSLTHKNLMFIDKTIRDKGDALNMGINVCKTPLYFSFDADTLAETDAASNLIFYFLSKPHTVAVGASICVLNGCKWANGVIQERNFPLKPIFAYQAIEYMKSFLFSRTGWNSLGGTLCYSGAFSMFETQAVIESKGYDLGNFSQDFEIITRLHNNRIDNKYPYSIGYTPTAAAWTDVPNTWGQYWKQRIKWQYGSLMSIMMYKHMLFNPKYGKVGMFTYPFYLFFEIFGCFVELIAYFTIPIAYYLNILDIKITILFILVAIGYMILLSVATGFMHFLSFNRYRKFSDLFLILVYSIIIFIGFRQYDVVCRVWASLKYFFDSLTGKERVIE